MVHFEGGLEAEKVRKFFGSSVPQVGDDAWNVGGWHTGTHPKGRVYETRDRYIYLWHAGYLTNPRVTHFHLGQSGAMPLSFFIEEATVYIDSNKLYDAGHLTILDLEEVRKLAAQYGDPDQLLTEVPLFD